VGTAHSGITIRLSGSYLCPATKLPAFSHDLTDGRLAQGDIKRLTLHNYIPTWY
jgi:hypothetical protein